MIDYTITKNEDLRLLGVDQQWRNIRRAHVLLRDGREMLVEVDRTCGRRIEDEVACEMRLIQQSDKAA